ncbi:MAG: TrmB family transcriptional regulator [Candidatus Hermodarchaeota archaeon]
MSEISHFKIFDFTETEADVYKLLIQLSKTPRLDDNGQSFEFEKVKAADLVTLSNYSKPKVYEVIKKLESLELVQIDQARPMSIKPLDPKIAIERLIENKKRLLEEAGTLMIQDINELPVIEPDVPLSDTAPLSYFNGIEKYLARLEYFLKIASKEIFFICGYLVKGEASILRNYISEKLQQGLKINILYGGSPIEIEDVSRLKFTDHFDKTVLDPIKPIINKYNQNFSLDGGFIGPPFRITLIDDTEIILAFKKYSKTDERIDIDEIAGIQSRNLDFVGAVKNIYYIINNFLVRQLKDPKLLKQLIKNMTNLKD